MDPVEAGDWLSGRPRQLVFLTGLDPANRKPHNALVNIFSSRSHDRPPLNLRLVSGELDLPAKKEKSTGKGIIRREWPKKYLERVPSLIVLFLDLDWDHSSWAEKKTEAESKCASIRASCHQGSRLAVVLLQDRSQPTPGDDPLATERAHELCQTCQLTPKQLFVVPVLGDVQGYVMKLETAFHELAQGFYQQKLKAIRARSIPNNSPALVVRQLFKLAFLSELRQDTHTALRNYRLAYEQCRDNVEHWDGIDIFEWRSVVGLLNYKMCELCFLHSTAVEAINQMRKHQSFFFGAAPGVYPTPTLASIEHQLWNAKQCWHFAQLFEQAVVGGLSALATLNPGTHLDQAAAIYSAVNKDIAALKAATAQTTTAYPTPDPLQNETVFFGQRPWRVGCDGLALPAIEADAVNAILQRLIINHDGVISLLTAAMGQFKRYGCHRMQKKVMNEMAEVYYSSGDCVRALQLWSLVVRDGLPSAVRSALLNRACWAAYSIASIKDFMWCALQLCPNESLVEEGLFALLAGQCPPLPYGGSHLTEDQISIYQTAWSRVLSEPQFFSVQASRIETFLRVQATFLSLEPVQNTEKVHVRVEISSTASRTLPIGNVIVAFHSAQKQRKASEETAPRATIERKNLSIPANGSASFIAILDLSAHSFKEGETIVISRVTVCVGEVARLSGQIEFEGAAVNKGGAEGLRGTGLRERQCGSNTLSIAVLAGGIVVDGGGVGDSAAIDCLVGEVADVRLVLKNTTQRVANRVRLEFKRNEQVSTAAAAVLFVDTDNELRSELILDCAASIEPMATVTVPLRLSAQLVGEMQLMLETSFLSAAETTRRVCKVPLSVTAREPFTVSSGVLSMNGLPVAQLLNHSEHVLKADIASNADIVITNVEWLLADVVTQLDTDSATSNPIEDHLRELDVISYCRVVCVEGREEDVETPLGRLAIEWKRFHSSSSVRSVVALCRLPVISCPVSIQATVFDSPAVVRQPIRIQYTLRSRSKEVVELTTFFDLSDTFMFCGDKRVTFRLLPGSSRVMNVVVMALTGGRLPFPKINLRSSNIPDNVLQHSARTLPATLFVLPNAKDPSSTPSSRGTTPMSTSTA